MFGHPCILHQSSCRMSYHTSSLRVRLWFKKTLTCGSGFQIIYFLFFLFAFLNINYLNLIRHAASHIDHYHCCFCTATRKYSEYHSMARTASYTPTLRCTYISDINHKRLHSLMNALKKEGQQSCLDTGYALSNLTRTDIYGTCNNPTLLNYVGPCESAEAGNCTDEDRQCKKPFCYQL